MKSLTVMDELAYQLVNLRLVSGLYIGDCHTTYKMVSLILRTILLGSSGDRALAAECLADPRLPRLRVTGPHASPGHLRMPADIVLRLGGIVQFAAGSYLQSVNVEGGAVAAATVGEMFGNEQIPLDVWLAQPFLEPPMTIATFIRAIAHKEGGAHVDLSHNDLVALQRCGFLHWPIIAKMGGAVADALLPQIWLTDPSFRIRLP